MPKRQRTTTPYQQRKKAKLSRQSSMTIAKANKIVRSQETKYYDFSKTATNLAQTGTLLTASCVTIAQGANESERIGKKIFVTKIMLRGSIRIPSSTSIADASNKIRIIVFHDRQANKNGTAVTASQLLVSDTINHFRNLDNSRRFKFLCDKTMNINQLCGGGNGTSDRLGEVTKGFQIYKDVNIPINYDSTTGAITELTESNIGIIAWCEEVTTTAPQIFYEGRIRFTD